MKSIKIDWNIFCKNMKKKILAECKNMDDEKFIINMESLVEDFHAETKRNGEIVHPGATFGINPNEPLIFPGFRILLEDERWEHMPSIFHTTQSFLNKYDFTFGDKMDTDSMFFSEYSRKTFEVIALLVQVIGWRSVLDIILDGNDYTSEIDMKRLIVDTVPLFLEMIHTMGGMGDTTRVSILRIGLDKMYSTEGLGDEIRDVIRVAEEFGVSGHYCLFISMTSLHDALKFKGSVIKQYFMEWVSKFVNTAEEVGISKALNDLEIQ